MYHRDILKLKASPAGGARIIRIVRDHLTKYGPSGVPNGLVDAQNRGQGRTPCLVLEVSEMPTVVSYCKGMTYRPHSRIMRDVPINTEMRLPKELRAIRKFKPLTALPEPKTLVKNRLAEICAAAAS